MSVTPPPVNPSDLVRVCARFRPLSQAEIYEQKKLERDKPSFETFRNIVYHSSDTVELRLSDEDANHTFTFSEVYAPHVSQEKIYDDVGAPIVGDVLSGYNGTILVYGQTGSGKTHTMMGAAKAVPMGSTANMGANWVPVGHEGGGGVMVNTQVTASIAFDGPDGGLIPRAVRDLFARMESAEDSMEFEVKIQFVELYMEHVTDLLDPTKGKLNVREDPSSCSFYVDGCSAPYVASPDELLDHLENGLQNRTTASTRMNDVSSRSHCILSISVKTTDLSKGEQRTGKLFLVDLAGSEKVYKTRAEGQQLEEAKIINKSLTALGIVINTLSDRKAPHIPYRDSKLTKLLQQSLGGNSRTTLIVCCSPSIFNEMESLSTLRFGARAKSIANRPVVNKEVSVEELKAMLVQAEREIERLRAVIINLGGDVNANVVIPQGQTRTQQQALIEKQLQQAQEDLFSAKRETEEARCEYESRLEEIQNNVERLSLEKEELAAKVRMQNKLITNYEREVAAWNQEYCILHTENAALGRRLKAKSDHAAARKSCIENVSKAIFSSRQELQNLQLLCNEALQEVAGLAGVVAQNDIRMVQHSQEQRERDSLEAQLMVLEKQYSEMEESWRVLMNENGAMMLELQLNEKKLGIRNERIENLKHGLREEKQARQELALDREVEVAAFKEQIQQSRSDAEYWRKRFEALQAQSAKLSGSRRFARSIRGGTADLCAVSSSSISPSHKRTGHDSF